MNDHFMGTTGEIGRPDMDPVIQHFSHLHPLKLLNFPPQTTNTFICAGCKLEASGWFYFCSTCNYCLHKTCSHMPRKVEHRVDPKHTLVLLSSPVYATGFFKCNACGKLDTGFCYHCKDCQLDIHTLCIYKPLSVNTSTHHHALELCFSPPYSKKKFQCDICKQSGSNHWLYRCGSCNYDVHMNCAMSNRLQPVTEIQQTQEQKLHHSNSGNIQIQPIKAIQVQQTKQQPQLLKSRSFPPRFPKFMTDLPNSGSTFHHVSQSVVPIQQQQICVPYVQTPNPIPQAGSSNWNQPYKVIGCRASMPTLDVRQHVPQPIHQMNGYTASKPTIAAIPQYVQPPNTTKLGNNLMGHVVQELVDGFIQQAGGAIFQSATSGDLPFDLDIGNS